MCDSPCRVRVFPKAALFRDRSGALSPFPARSVRVLGNSLSSVVQGQAGRGRAPVCMGSGCGTCGLWQVLVEFLAEMRMARKSAKRRNCQLCVPRSCTVPTECTPRLHWPFWLPPEAAPSPLGALQGCTSPAEHPPGQQGEGAAARTPSLSLQGFGAVCHPHPPCPREHHVAARTRCLFRALSPAGLPSRQGPACHCGLSHRAAAQHEMTRFSLLFLSREG